MAFSSLDWAAEKTEIPSRSDNTNDFMKFLLDKIPNPALYLAGSFLTGTPVQVMGRHDEDDGGNKEEILVTVKELLEHQHSDSGGKEKNRVQPVMVLEITIEEGIGADDKSQGNHAVLKPGIVNDIDAKKREGADKQGQKGAMDGAGYGGRHPNGIPVDPNSHKGCQR